MPKRSALMITVVLLALALTPIAGLAQSTGEAAPTPTPTHSPTTTTRSAVDDDGGFLGSWGFPLILIGGLLLMYIWMGRARRKKESQRRELLESLKKGDKIVTIGGIVGTVIEVRENEVTVKVDESNNVRMKFARWSVRQVGDGPKGDSADEQDSK